MRVFGLMRGFKNVQVDNSYTEGLTLVEQLI